MSQPILSQRIPASPPHRSPPCHARRRVAAFALLALAAVSTACSKPEEPTAAPPAATQATAEADAPAAGIGDKDMPALSIATLDHGTFDLAQHRAQWVVVNFWATWCAPCLKEIPDLTALDAAREDVQVIGLAYEEIEPEAMRAFLAKHPAGYPIAILDVYQPLTDFDTPRGLPMSYLIAPGGKVAKKFVGPVTSDQLERAIGARSAG